MPAAARPFRGTLARRLARSAKPVHRLPALPYSRCERLLPLAQPVVAHAHALPQDCTRVSCCRVDEGEVVLQVALHVPHAPQFISQEWLVLGSQVRRLPAAQPWPAAAWHGSAACGRAWRALASVGRRAACSPLLCWACACCRRAAAGPARSRLRVRTGSLRLAPLGILRRWLLTILSLV